MKANVFRSYAHIERGEFIAAGRRGGRQPRPRSRVREGRVSESMNTIYTTKFRCSWPLPAGANGYLLSSLALAVA